MVQRIIKRESKKGGESLRHTEEKPERKTWRTKEWRKEDKRDKGEVERCDERDGGVTKSWITKGNVGGEKEKGETGYGGLASDGYNKEV